MRKNKLRFLAVGVMAAGMISLTACTDNSGSGSGTTPAAVGQQATEAAESEPADAESSGTESTSAERTGTEASDGADTTTAETSTESKEDAETPFGSFTSVFLDGEEVTEEIFSKAGLTMVNIWGTYCGPCIQEMPDLGELSAEYGGDDFQLLGIVIDALGVNDENVLEIVELTGADYPHILLSQELIDNYMNKVQAVPTTVFLDREGRQVGKVHMGSKSKAQWEAIIKELLAETGGDTDGDTAG